jgi:PHD/YefM family antitoxin component YafN of YafNO toxin-antitoxin module
VSDPLEDILDEVERTGEAFVITRDDEPVAVVCRYEDWVDIGGVFDL